MEVIIILHHVVKNKVAMVNKAKKNQPRQEKLKSSILLFYHSIPRISHNWIGKKNKWRAILFSICSLYCWYLEAQNRTKEETNLPLQIKWDLQFLQHKNTWNSSLLSKFSYNVNNTLRQLSRSLHSPMEKI